MAIQNSALGLDSDLDPDPDLGAAGLKSTCLPRIIYHICNVNSGTDQRCNCKDE